MLDHKGNMYVEEDDIIELMLSNKQAKILPRNVQSFKLFESTCKTYGIKSPFELDSSTDDISWNMPKEYQTLDIKKHIASNYTLDKEQWARVDLELTEFKQRNLTDLLRFLVYFITTLRSNNIVYGVGRGSSIASYVLYLLKVHRIDSLKYNLDIKEFLK
jgi:DNA polymerase III alpha subunit